MSRINLISIVLLSCLFQQGIAMNQDGNQPPINQLGDPVLNKQAQVKFKKDWNEKRSKEQIDRDAFWEGQFGADNKFKNLDPRLQKSIAQNFMLPMSKTEKAREAYKFCLPMAVTGLTPARIENVENDLKEYYAQFKSEYVKKYNKEPNSLVPTIVACANSHGELRKIVGEPVSNVQDFVGYPAASTIIINAGIDAHDRIHIGAAKAAIYSNGSIEWIVDPVDHEVVTNLSAERKVLAARLYKETLQATRAIGVQLGRKRTVDDRYNQLFFANPAVFLSVNVRALENFGNVQTKQSKKWNQLIRCVAFTGNVFAAWFSYHVFFKNKTYQWNKPVHGLVGMVGLSYVAAGLIQATKSLIGGLINL